MKRWIALICALVCALGLNCIAGDGVAAGEPVQFGTGAKAEASDAGKYAEAEALLAAGEIAKAAIRFGSANHYEDSWERSMELWNQVAERKTLCAEAHHLFVLKPDGSVSFPKEFRPGGIDDFEPTSRSIDASAFKNAIALSGSDFNVAGLKADGTVVVAGDNSFGQCEVSGWKDIVSIASNFYFTVGLQNDGSVVVTKPDSAAVNVAQEQMRTDEELDLEPIIRDLSQWSDIVEVVASPYHFNPHVVGLKADGTVVAAGGNSYGECDVSDWTDIVAVNTSSSTTIGLKSDGTAVVAGKPISDMRQDILEWTDIVDVASLGGSLAAGLKSDGTVTLAGVDGFIENEKSHNSDYVAHYADMLSNLASWSNIVDIWPPIIVMDCIMIYGMRADGTIISNDDGSSGELDSYYFSRGPGWDHYFTFSGARISGKAAQRAKDMAEAQQAERAEAQAAEWEQLQAREFPTLQKGDKGEEVRALQERLVALGYLNGAADGDFGNKTEAAVKDFQSANALEPTGIADTPTQRLAFFSGAAAK